MFEKAAQILARVFDPDDCVWATGRLGRAYSIPQEVALRHFVGLDSEKGVYLALNGCNQPGLRRCGDNVVKYRTLLTEFDGVPLEEQRALVKAAGLPFTACIYSGGKSYHFLTSVTEPFATVAEYKEVFARIHLLLGSQNDKACSDPGRWSRMPYGVRGGIVQEVVEIRDRVGTRELLSMLPSLPVPELRPTRLVSPRSISDSHTTVSREEIVELLSVYLASQRIPYTGNTFAPCPVCRAEGRDRHGDNLHISGKQMVFHCFSGGREHDSQVASELLHQWGPEALSEEVHDLLQNSKNSARSDETGQNL